MSIMTVTTTPHWKDITAEVESLNPCQIHGLQPKAEAALKGKYPREKRTGWNVVSCPSCLKEDPNRNVFGYGNDPVREWNKNNPIISGPVEALRAERKILLGELPAIHQKISELFKEREEVSARINAQVELSRKKLSRIQQIAEHIDA